MKTILEGMILAAAILIPAALFVSLASNGHKAVEGMIKVILGL